MVGSIVAPSTPVDQQAGAPDHTGLIVEAIPDAIAIVDRQGVIADVNRHMVMLTGQCRADLLGVPLRECFVEKDQAEACIQNAFIHGSVADSELTLLPPGGGHTVVHCDASTLQSGPAARVLVVLRDAPAQAQAHALALASLVQSADDAIVGKTVDGVITSWNSGAERLYGFSVEEVMGRPFDLVIPEAVQDAEAKMLRRVAAGERIEPYEADRLGKDGTPLTVSVAISPIMDATGRIVGQGTYSPSFGQGMYQAFFCADFQGARIRNTGTFQTNNATTEPKVLDMSSNSWYSSGSVGAWIQFDKPATHSILARVGVSFISADQACASAESEIPDFNFGRVEQDARDEWSDKLSAIEIDATGVSEELQTTFWSGIYRTLLSPQNYTGENQLWNSTEPYYDS